MSDELRTVNKNMKFEEKKARRREVHDRERRRKKAKGGRKNTKGQREKLDHQRPRPKRQFDQKMRRRFLENYAELGSKRLAAESVGFQVTTINRHLKENPLFAQQFEQVQDQMTEVLEEEAFRRAVRGVDKPIYYKGEFVAYQKEYSDSLLKELLAANAPEKYGKVNTTTVQGNVSVTGPDGGPVEVTDAKSKLLNIIDSQAKDVTSSKEDEDEDEES